MKRFARTLLTATAALLLPWSAATAVAQGSATEESLATVGITTTGGGFNWAYLAWTTNVPDLLDARTYAIYQKPGAANSASPYTRVALVQVQMDASAIGALIERAAIATGENTTEMDEVVRNLFESLMPSGSITTADRVSAVVRGAIADPENLKNLMIAAKAYPSLSMVMGRAHALPIPGAGQQTFEVREYDTSKSSDVAVVGRTTVDPAQPYGFPGLLPAPTVLREPPLNPALGKNDMSIRFVWDTPTNFRQVALLAHGFNLYRVKRAFAESNGIHLAAPSGAVLATFAAGSPNDVQRINRAPITPPRPLTAAEVMTVNHETVFFSDHESRFPGYPTTHVPPKNGDQYYYYVTSRDILGRDSLSQSSPGLLATFCSRMPPPVVRGVKVTNDYSYDGVTQKQKLKVTWNGASNTGDKKTTAYLVYRWENTDQIYQLGGNPLNNFVHGPVPHVDGQETYSWVDDIPGSPSMPDDTGKTYWYTVRAVDDGSQDKGDGNPPVCDIAPFGGNLSGHGAPAFGVLRDRVGPARPDATVQFLCPDLTLEYQRKGETIFDERLDQLSYRIGVKVQQVPYNPDIAWAEFTWMPAGGGSQFLGRFPFEPGSAVFERLFEFPLTMAEGGQLRVRTGMGNGVVSPIVSVSVAKPQTPQYYQILNFDTSVIYNRVTAGLSSERGGCVGHVRPPQGVPSPDGFDGIKIPFFPPKGTAQWKLFTRVDNGPLTLALEDSGTFDETILETIEWASFPAVHTRVCFFLQVFDLNGNPSAMQNIECVEVEGSQPLPTPMLAPVTSAGTDGNEAALLQWFCAPYGVDHFEVWIASSAGLPADDLDGPGRDIFELNTAYPLPNNVLESSGGVLKFWSYRVYDTERIGPLFGSGANFSALALPTVGAKWRVKVRAVTPLGTKGPFSNVVEYTWTQPAAAVGPDVPWPQRPLPSVTDSFLSPNLVATWLATDSTAAIRVGMAPGRFSYDQEKKTFFLLNSTPYVDYLFKGTLEDGTERTILPVTVYRVQETDPAGNFPASGDIVQVSPLLETIVDKVESISGGGLRRVLYDPFFTLENVTLEAGSFVYLYIKDTQPQVGGARYRYLMVLHDPETREVIAIIPTNTVDIPTPSVP